MTTRMSSSIRWQVVEASTFPRLAAHWDALNEAGFRSPVLHADFVGPLLTHFGDGSQRIAFVEEDGRWRRACIVTKTNAFVHDTFQPSQAPIGLWLQDDGARGLPDATTLSALAAALGSTTALFGLSQLDPELVARPTDDVVMTSDYIDTARVTIAGSFDDYWAARGKNLRANMKKQRNKLDSEGIALRFDCLTAVSDVAAAIVDYGRLESAGWKASGGTAVSADNEQGRFYRDVFERFAARGMARIYRCFYGHGSDERVAAMDLCIEHDGVMVILKTAFDESIRGTSPAFLMRHDYFPALFADGRLKRIEFYGRVMEWHTKWSEEVRTLYHATTYRWPLVARLDALRRSRSARSAARSETSETPVTASASATGTAA